MNPGEDAEILAEHVNKTIDSAVIRKEIEELFHTYYSAENHVRNIVALASVCLR